MASPSPTQALMPSPVPADATQLVTTVVPDWDATTGVMRVWHRARGSIAWKPDGPGWPVVVGTHGSAWGRGLHGELAPAGRAGPAKVEGDGRAPAGVFELRAAYGYAATAPAGTALPYAALTETTECVDDPRSRRYTHILEHDARADWTSAEHMRRRDDLYTWVIDVAHNPDAVARGGSCIFLHVWRDAATPTVGCTAMAEPHLRGLLTRLAPGAVYVLLPRAEYAAAQPGWGLPSPSESETVEP